MTPEEKITITCPRCEMPFVSLRLAGQNNHIDELEREKREAEAYSSALEDVLEYRLGKQYALSLQDDARKKCEEGQ